MAPGTLPLPMAVTATQKTGDSVMKMALDSGDNSALAFSAAFRKEFGFTPREAMQKEEETLPGPDQ